MHTSSSSTTTTTTIYESSYPYFERLDKDDFTELQHCRSLITTLQKRIRYLEDMNINLESRLEKEARVSVQLEREIVELDALWKNKVEILTREIEKWKKEFQVERSKNEKLRENLSRTERELHGIYQRKYDLIKGQGKAPPGGPMPSSSTTVGNNLAGNMGASSSLIGDNLVTRKIPESTLIGEDLYQQVRAPQDAKQRKMTANVSQFLGLL